MDRDTVEFSRIPSTDGFHITVPAGPPGSASLIGPGSKIVDNKVLDVEASSTEERAQWSNPTQFFMTILGFCVGLGNIWRFPYLCQQNGGGAFVLPFLLMMVLEGMPLLLLELGIGQRMRQGSLGVWNMVHPWLGGIGLGSTVIAAVVGCYYNVIIAWCLYYFFNSFTGTLPWSQCPTEVINNVTVAVAECEMSSETQYFWYRQTLDITGSISDFDGVRWWMFLCLLAAWIIVYFIVMKGIQSSGKVVYFTALFPYVVLTIFFVRGLTLPGAGAGLAHMFYPKLDMLAKPTVWLDAANQVFYSYGLAFGSIISFGSYNAPNTNCVKDVYLLSACNAFTAVYACAVIFAILGFKAQHLFEKCMEHDVSLILGLTELWPGRNVSDITETEYSGLIGSHVLAMNSTYMEETFVGSNSLKFCSLEQELDQAAKGTGLAFIVMADVFTKLPGAPFWSLLFFAMLLSLGLGSQIGILEGMISTLFDMPALKHISKPILTAIACGICFLIGLVFTTGAGEYWLTLFDSYGAMGLTLIALTEIVSIMYVYGHKKFTQDIEDMTGVRPGLYWQLTWRFIAPVLLTGILGTSVVFQLRKHPTYSTWQESTGTSGTEEFPAWTMVIALILATASVVPIIVICVLRMTKYWELDPSAYKVPMKRVETTASTHPMMGYTDKIDEDRRDSSDSDGGIVVDEPSSIPTNKPGEEQLIDPIC